MEAEKGSYHQDLRDHVLFQPKALFVLLVFSGPARSDWPRPAWPRPHQLKKLVGQSTVWTNFLSAKVDTCPHGNVFSNFVKKKIKKNDTTKFKN